METKEIDNEEPEIHTIVDIYYKNNRFFAEIKDEDDHAFVILNAENLAKLNRLCLKHIAAHQAGERTVEMIEKAEQDEIIDYNLELKKTDCISYDLNEDYCTHYGTDDPICCSDGKVCDEYAKKDVDK